MAAATDRSPRWPRRIFYLALLTCCFLPGCLRAQQSEVERYDLYTGFTSFDTPHLNLTERGFNLQAGTNLRGWLSTGFDFAVVTGHSSLTPSMLKSSLQQEIDEELALLTALGELPPGYQLVVPTDSTSYTFAAGPQLAYRHFRSVTLFARPSLGAVRQTATPHVNPADPVATAIVAALVPSGQKTDWQGFYGFGGGLDWNATRHIGLRMQTDFVYWHLFNDLIDGTWTVRYSVGPTFHFGRNILAPK
jgi:hypothetical protein